MPAISAVFTITYVAEMLGEDEEWLHELPIDMFAEDGRLRVYSRFMSAPHDSRDT